MMKKFRYLFGILLMIMAISSCDLDINKDPNYPDDVKGEKYFASAQMFVAGSVGGDLQLLGGMWAQHYAQNAGSNQYTNIDSYNLPNSNTYITRSWSLLYAGALADLQISLKKAEAAGEWHYWLASKVMTAYTYHILVEAYGDVPFTESLQFETISDPKFDDAKSINSGIIAMLDEAIAKKADATNPALVNMGTNDFVFGGSINDWVKFAKSLKLKILMRDPNFANNATAIQALLTEGDLLVKDAKIAVFVDKENNSNPLFENDRRKLNTQNNIRASSTLALYLRQTADPRISVFMEKAKVPDATLGNYVGLPQGGYTLGAAYQDKSSRALIKAEDPVYFMSVVELDFLKAEAFVKLNDAASAKISYDKGVTGAFARWAGALDINKTPVFPDNFNVNEFIGAGKVYEFNQTSEQTMLESIWRQKWIAGVRAQAWESFLEINRTGYPNYGTVNSQSASYVIGTLAPSINTVLPAGQYPKRLIYPKSSTDYNKNTPVAIPIQTKLWWHKQ
jgi:hypothetical protein